MYRIMIFIISFTKYHFHKILIIKFLQIFNSNFSKYLKLSSVKRRFFNAKNTILSLSLIFLFKRLNIKLLFFNANSNTSVLHFKLLDKKYRDFGFCFIAHKASLLSSLKLFDKYCTVNPFFLPPYKLILYHPLIH